MPIVAQVTDVVHGPLVIELILNLSSILTSNFKHRPVTFLATICADFFHEGKYFGILNGLNNTSKPENGPQDRFKKSV